MWINYFLNLKSKSKSLIGFFSWISFTQITSDNMPYEMNLLFQLHNVPIGIALNAYYLWLLIFSYWSWPAQLLQLLVVQKKVMFEFDHPLQNSFSDPSKKIFESQILKLTSNHKLKVPSLCTLSNESVEDDEQISPPFSATWSNNRKLLDLKNWKHKVS